MKVMSTVSILSVLLGGAFAPGKKTQKVHLTIRCFGVTVWVYMNFHSALPPPLPYSNLEPLPGFVAEIMMVTCLHLVGCPDSWGSRQNTQDPLWIHCRSL